MKKLLLLVAFLSVGLAYQSAIAQVRISASVNIGRPVWAPPSNVYVENYYFPDLGVYYDMNIRQYRYMDRGRWVCAPALPVYYRNVDLVRARKVVIHERNPYLRNDYWRARYRDNRRDYGRPDYRDNRRDDRGDWDRHDNGRHRGHDKRHK